ncbi:MAG: hypothetical protein RMJ82_15330 [Gemmatales bacterium]|nr:hypothetical protein [Gemmatales bacterium]
MAVEELERRDLMNAAPIIGSLLFDNISPHTTDTLQVQVVDVVDADNDPLTFQYDWRVNGQLVQTSTSSSPTVTLDLSQPGFGDRGDVIEVTVAVSDGSNTTSATAALTVVASPSELYADYLAAVELANAAYDASVNTALTTYGAAVATAKATADAEEEAADSAFQNASEAALQAYTSAESSAESTLQTAIAGANQAFDEAEGAAWANLLAGLSAAEAQYLHTEQLSWTHYLSRLTEIQNQVDGAMLLAHSNLQAVLGGALSTWQASEQAAWDAYVNAIGPELVQTRAQVPVTELPPPETHPITADQRVQMAGMQIYLVAPAAFLGNSAPVSSIVGVDFQQPQRQRRPRGVIAIEPAAGPGAEGTQITVSVRMGFDANATLPVDFDGDQVDILQNGQLVPPGNLRTDGQGRATFSIRLRRNYPRTALINPINLEPVGYRIRVTSGVGMNTVFAYGHYIVTR